jgi:WD40 repeat protein
VGHSKGAAIVSLSACAAQGVAVSGAEDGTAVVWDLGRRELTRVLRGHKAPVSLVQVNAANGNVLTLAGTELRLWHINGDLLAVADLAAAELPRASALLAPAVFEHQPGIAAVVGHEDGQVSLWDLLFPGDLASGSPRPGSDVRFQLRAVLKKPPASSSTSPSSPAAPSAVSALAVSHDGRTLVVADEQGAISRWVSAEAVAKKFPRLLASRPVAASDPGAGKRGSNLGLTMLHFGSGAGPGGPAAV